MMAAGSHCTVSIAYSRGNTKHWETYDGYIFPSHVSRLKIQSNRGGIDSGNTYSWRRLNVGSVCDQEGREGDCLLPLRGCR